MHGAVVLLKAGKQNGPVLKVYNVYYVKYAALSIAKPVSAGV
jgi:hypothetical protein